MPKVSGSDLVENCKVLGCWAYPYLASIIELLGWVEKNITIEVQNFGPVEFQLKQVLFAQFNGEFRVGVLLYYIDGDTCYVFSLDFRENDLPSDHLGAWCRMHPIEQFDPATQDFDFRPRIRPKLGSAPAR